MVSRRRFLVLLGATATAAGAIAIGVLALPGEAPSDGLPPRIRYGREQCVYCGMTIDDARFAAAWRTRTGVERHFDDIGCMVNAIRRDAPEAHFFVHDYADKSWLDADGASYVISPSIRTPMAYGVAAFAHPEAARAFVTGPQPPVYGWNELDAHVERKS